MTTSATNKESYLLRSQEPLVSNYHFIYLIPQIGDEKKAASLGMTDLPSLVYYEDNIPNIYKGDLRIERDVLDWLVEQLNNDEIEEVTDEILDKLIEKHQTIIAVFCKKVKLF